MSALDDDVLGTEVVTDLEQLATARAAYLQEYGHRMPLQDAERAAGLTEADIWAFEKLYNEAKKETPETDGSSGVQGHG